MSLVTTTRIYGTSLDELLAYDTDDSVLSESDA